MRVSRVIVEVRVQPVTTFIRRHLRWLALVAFGLSGALMGVIASRLAAKVEQERASAVAADYFSGRAAAFGREMREITEELQHIRSFFVAARHVSRTEFRVFRSRNPVAPSGHRCCRMGPAGIRRRPAAARA